MDGAKDYELFHARRCQTAVGLGAFVDAIAFRDFYPLFCRSLPLAGCSADGVGWCWRSGKYPFLWSSRIDCRYDLGANYGPVGRIPTTTLEKGGLVSDGSSN